MIQRHLEELTLNAWPALENLLYDGWVLSFSNGYTRRANSIHPLYPSSVDFAEKIATCEAMYAARGQETVFKVTSSADDAGLDKTLERLGYIRAAQTSVQSVQLTQLPSETDNSVTLWKGLEPSWFEAFNRLTVTPERFQPTMRSMLEKITPPHAFAAISLNGQIVAQGLGVAERGYVGLFDIIVDSQVRNQGLGRRVVSRLLDWARAEEGAHTAHLAVMCDNAPAQRLYANLGFREVYTYWYRGLLTSRGKMSGAPR
jgi:RimJ/RimL family protein N-acetyltransferase